MTYNKNALADDMQEIINLLCPQDNTQNSLQRQINAHKRVYSRTRSKGVQLEELIFNVFKSTEKPVTWYPESHVISTDMEFEPLKKKISISIKSGVLKANGSLVISGSRLGKFKIFFDKLKHIKDTSADIYICVAGKKSAEASDPYHVFIFDKHSLDYGEAKNWVETEKNWKIETPTLKGTVHKSLSSQLWTEIKDITSIAYHKVIE